MDPRASSLIENFVGQWLYLRNLEGHYPDPAGFPEFDENLREAFQRETELFIDDQMRADRGVLELMSADYTFVNERLARHYGIPGVYGSRFRRVDLDPAQRGGLLGHGSLLTVTSYPNRTSPVLRGKFVLENLLGSLRAGRVVEVNKRPAVYLLAQDGAIANMRRCWGRAPGSSP